MPAEIFNGLRMYIKLNFPATINCNKRCKLNRFDHIRFHRKAYLQAKHTLFYE